MPDCDSPDADHTTAAILPSAAIAGAAFERPSTAKVRRPVSCFPPPAGVEVPARPQAAASGASSIREAIVR